MLPVFLPGRKPDHFVREIEGAVLRDALSPKQLRAVISLVLLVIGSEMNDSDGFSEQSMVHDKQQSIRRAS